MQSIPIGQLTMAAFSGWVKARFRVFITPTDIIEMELTEVNPAPAVSVAKPGSATCESFSVIFAGPNEPVLPQRIYAFENEEIGRFEIFIVPIGRVAGCVHYQAAFNRLTRPVQVN